MTTIYFIRHAEAEGNLYRRIHGQYDSLLTPNGWQQIRALRERFRDIPVDAVYSSDRFRTMNTARAIYVPKGLTLNTRADLREINMGEWEDRSWAAKDREDHDMMKKFGTTSPEFRAPGGESYEELRSRGAAAILDIAAKHPGQTVAVFAHGTMMRGTLSKLMGYTLDQMREMGHSDNTAVSKIEIEDGKANVIYMDDNSHLSEAISTMAGQNWWRKDEKRPDLNFWYRPLDLNDRNDRDFCHAVRQDAWRTVYGSMDNFHGELYYRDAEAAWNADHDSLTAAMFRDKPIGMLQMDFADGAENGRGHISLLYIRESLRGQKMGVQLIGKAVSLSRRRGREWLNLYCAPRNERALAFYRKYGFEIVGETEGANGPLYVMEKYIGYEYRGEVDE